MAIGIFDSGIGGLSVYKKLKEKFPKTKFIYFADLQNFPYGEKENSDILEYSKNIVEFLKSQEVTSIVVACNTASAVSLLYLEKNYDIKFTGMIKYITDELKNEEDNSLTLIATRKTIESFEYESKLSKKIKYSIKAPKLVEYAEKLNKMGIEDVIKEYLNEEIVSTTKIILACTHFPLLTKYILKVFPDAKLLDPADYVVKNIKIDDSEGEDVFYTSANLEYFKIQLTNILGKENIDVRVHKWNTNN